MTADRYDVLGLGNAIVDVITRADDAFLATHDMRKGGMALIDEARAAQVYDAMGPAIEMSGGSAANTIVGAAGRRAHGLRRQDQGRPAGSGLRPRHPRRRRQFRHTARHRRPFHRSLLCAYPGAAQNLHPRDIDADTVAGAAITYLEGYLWDPAHAKEAFVCVIDGWLPSGLSHRAGRLQKRGLKPRANPCRNSCFCRTKPIPTAESSSSMQMEAPAAPRPPTA